MNKNMLLILVLLASVLLIAGCAGKTKIYQPQGQITTPAAQPQAGTAPSGAETAVSAPGASEATMQESVKCESVYGIGWVPSSCQLQTGSFKVTLKAVGQNGIAGIAFYVTGTSGIRKVLRDDTKVNYGETQSYSFSTSDLEPKIGGKVQEILALPIKSTNGTDYACFNQRLLIIKDEACKG